MAIPAPLLDVMQANKGTPGLYGSIIARTLFFDAHICEAVQERGFRQFVSLGAGYDMRSSRKLYNPPDVRQGDAFENKPALSLRKVKGMRAFEVDLELTQQDKKTLLKKHGFPMEHLAFVATDMEKTSVDELMQRLEEQGFDRSQPTVVLIEG